MKSRFTEPQQEASTSSTADPAGCSASGLAAPWVAGGDPWRGKQSLLPRSGAAEDMASKPRNILHAFKTSCQEPHGAVLSTSGATPLPGCLTFPLPTTALHPPLLADKFSSLRQ